MKKATILIVEDEKSLRTVLSRHLKQYNYSIITASDGEEAIALFKSKRPDLIVLDIIMPKKNGIEILEEIRIKHKSQIPIIIVSNLDQPQDLQTAKNLGIQGYHIKSNISLHELTSQISAIVPKNLQSK